ncbi:hypothetical protein AVEN_133223-1, partial [Araneus ventricosus]
VIELRGGCATCKVAPIVQGSLILGPLPDPTRCGVRGPPLALPLPDFHVVLGGVGQEDGSACTGLHRYSPVSGLPPSHPAWVILCCPSSRSMKRLALQAEAPPPEPSMEMLMSPEAQGPPLTRSSMSPRGPDSGAS